MARFVVLALATVMMSAPTSEPAESAMSDSGPRISEGGWGGDHVRLEVTTAGATVDYDCAHGTIDGRLALDARGRFDAKGTHVKERGGPEGEGEPKREPARYTGRVDGHTLTLTVTLTRSGEKVGTFTLTRGKAGRLRKCL